MWPALCVLVALATSSASAQPAPVTPKPSTPEPVTPSPMTQTAPATVPGLAPIAGNEPGMDTARLFKASSQGEDVLGRVITIEDAVELALANVPDIAARLQDYAAARYRFMEALTPLLPQFTASVGSQKTASTTVVSARTRFLNFGPPPPAVGPPIAPLGSRATEATDSSSNFKNNFLAQTSLSQLLFDFGKTKASADSAKKLADIALLDVENQRLLAVLAVKEAYTNMLLAQRLVRVNLDALQRAQLNLRGANRLADGGIRPKADIARAEIDVANGEIGLVSATGSQGLARAALNVALGIDVRAETRITDNLSDEPIHLDRNALLAEALGRRPEYLQAKLQVQSNEAIERLAVRQFFPTISATGTYGGSQELLNKNYVAGVNMSWTIMDGGNMILKIKEAHATTESSRALVKSAELSVSQDVQQGVVNVEESHARITSAKRAVKASDANYRFATGRFRAGLAAVIDVTDAQSQLTSAQATLAQALSDFRIALYRLDRAVGRR